MVVLNEESKDIVVNEPVAGGILRELEGLGIVEGVCFLIDL